MLCELHIENLAVIENATISLENNLNVFSGETGAGKSVLIGGINAILGQRMNKDIIRAGKSKAFVSAVFADIPKAVKEKLGELGYENDDDLIISREISIDGKSTAKINSRPANVSSLKEIGDMLVNIHGQHESGVLLDPNKHLSILDGYAESERLILDYQEAFKELQSVAREINKLRLAEKSRSQREAYLSTIISEIEPLNISPGDDEAVEERFRFADNAVSLTRAINAAMAALCGDEESDGASGMIASAYTELRTYEDIMKSLKPIADRISSLGIEINDIFSELSHLLSTVDLDEEEYDKLTQRRSDLNRIKKRYGPTLDDVIALYESARSEMDGLSASTEMILELEQKKSVLLSQVTKKAEVLSEFRKKAAERFTAEVTKELSFLNMPDVRIEVSFKKGKLTHDGMDNVEFLISANRGELPKPLAKIASGGELSRIMLALKTVLADRDDIPTLIFDEIDAGVSGRAAQKIGIKLREISRKRQVLCVTHLPQIAIMADNHMLIEKNVHDERTVTEIKSLDFNERVYEIARILGGDNITETVLKDAEEQLRSVMQ